jgi:hypothetical protein
VLFLAFQSIVIDREAPTSVLEVRVVLLLVIVLVICILTIGNLAGLPGLFDLLEDLLLGLSGFIVFVVIGVAFLIEKLSIVGLISLAQDAFNLDNVVVNSLKISIDVFQVR